METAHIWGSQRSHIHERLKKRKLKWVTYGILSYRVRLPGASETRKVNGRLRRADVQWSEVYLFLIIILTMGKAASVNSLRVRWKFFLVSIAFFKIIYMPKWHIWESCSEPRKSHLWNFLRHFTFQTLGIVSYLIKSVSVLKIDQLS